MKSPKLSFVIFFIVFCVIVSCSPVHDFYGEWSPASPVLAGKLSLDRHSISYEQVFTDSFGDVVRTSYAAFPYSLKKAHDLSGSWNIVNNLDDTVCGTINPDSDTLSVCSCSWVRSSSDDTSDYMLDADMSWLEGTWCLQADGICTQAQSFSFKSDNGFHTGTFMQSASAGIPCQGVFYVCDSLVQLSYGGLIPARSLTITQDMSLCTPEGRILTK